MLWGGFCVVAVGRLGRKKKRARGARWEGWESSPARFLFFRLFYFDGDTQRKPMRRREPFTLKLMILSLLELLHFLKQIIFFRLV